MNFMILGLDWICYWKCFWEFCRSLMLNQCEIFIPLMLGISEKWKISKNWKIQLNFDTKRIENIYKFLKLIFPIILKIEVWNLHYLFSLIISKNRINWQSFEIISDSIILFLNLLEIYF